MTDIMEAIHFNSTSAVSQGMINNLVLSAFGILLTITTIVILGKDVIRKRKRSSRNRKRSVRKMASDSGRQLHRPSKRSSRSSKRGTSAAHKGKHATLPISHERERSLNPSRIRHPTQRNQGVKKDECAKHDCKGNRTSADGPKLGASATPDVVYLEMEINSNPQCTELRETHLDSTKKTLYLWKQTNSAHEINAPMYVNNRREVTVRDVGEDNNVKVAKDYDYTFMGVTCKNMSHK